MKRLLFMLFLLPNCINAQQIKQAIQWVKASSWNEVRELAKKENKYIFVDVYTTWCGPCKRMDEEVYTDEFVGMHMNKRFINVQVQIDKTRNDNEYIRRWYNDAELLQQQYKVVSVPTYLFFDPSGKIVHRGSAFLKQEEFLTMAFKAFDPKSQFYTLKAQYESGQKDSKIMAYLFNESKIFGDLQLAGQIRIDYLNHLEKQPKKILYQKENLEFIAAAMPDTKSKWFKMFFPNGEKVNGIIGRNGFARRATDSAIARQYINPMLNKLKAGDSPDWEKMFNEIKKDFSEEYARRVISYRKGRWFRDKNDAENYTVNFLELVAMDGLDTTFHLSDIEINAFANFYVLKNSRYKDNEGLLTKAVKMMEGVVRRADNTINFHQDRHKDSVLTIQWKAMKIDTYADLLYKAGRRQEAISWEHYALKLAESINAQDRVSRYQETLQLMKKGEF